MEKSKSFHVMLRKDPHEKIYVKTTKSRKKTKKMLLNVNGMTLIRRINIISIPHFHFLFIKKDDVETRTKIEEACLIESDLELLNNKTIIRNFRCLKLSDWLSTCSNCRSIQAEAVILLQQKGNILDITCVFCSRSNR